MKATLIGLVLLAGCLQAAAPATDINRLPLRIATEVDQWIIDGGDWFWLTNDDLGPAVNLSIKNTHAAPRWINELQVSLTIDGERFTPFYLRIDEEGYWQSGETGIGTFHFEGVHALPVIAIFCVEGTWEDDSMPDACSRVDPESVAPGFSMK